MTETEARAERDARNEVVKFRAAPWHDVVRALRMGERP